MSVTERGYVELHIETTEDYTALKYDFGSVASAFVGVDITLPEGGSVDLVHADMIADDGSIDPHGCASRCVVRLCCPSGRTRFESFEPYSVRYLKMIIRGAKTFTLNDVFLRRYQYPDLKGGTFLCNDGQINRIDEAARLTLLANTLDVFMDTPTRERGGWLCDSFWTSRAARMMLGETKVERTMLENFLAPTVAEHFDGYLPPVYPAGKAVDLPNWTMYMIPQLVEFYRRTGDREFIDGHEGRLDEIVADPRQLRDAAGLRHAELDGLRLCALRHDVRQGGDPQDLEALDVLEVGAADRAAANDSNVDGTRCHCIPPAGALQGTIAAGLTRLDESSRLIKAVCRLR